MLENDTLDKIALEIKNCKLCLLCSTRKHTVPGEGGFLKKLMIIGEAPGYYEDQSGRPFIGAAGKILRNTLSKNDINIKDVFITNIIKCRPPNNRPPYINEKKICVQYLQRQILVLQPKIICLLGNVVSAYILGIKSITNERGRILHKNDLKYFVTYHPAATIYNRNLLNIFEQDIKKLAEYISLNN
jgi:uracil-DNA glycosylase